MNKVIKIKTTLIAISIACFSSLYGQSILKNDQELNGYDQIPDYRNQILWMSNLKLNTLNAPITFFTSDVRSTYKIYLEGFTLKGEPLSLKELIFVN